MNGVRIERKVPTAVEPTARVLEVAAMFGLGVDEAREMTLVPETTIPLRAGRIVFVTGPSGGGKSTVLNLIAEQRPDAIRFEQLLEFDDRPLIESIGADVEQATRYLALAGLADAFVMLRKPTELSDGQRYRLALARAIERAEAMTHQRPDAEPLILADEFGATLDRATAAAIARNLRRWTSASRACIVAATTHDDLLEPLCPDVLVYKPLGEGVEVLERR